MAIGSYLLAHAQSIDTASQSERTTATAEPIIQPAPLRFLPDPIELTWLIERLGDDRAEAIAEAHEAYLARYRPTLEADSPLVSAAYDDYRANEYPLLGKIRTLLRLWQKGHRRLEAVDESLWASLGSLNFDAMAIERARVERRAGFFDVYAMNTLPEHSIDLRKTLVDLNIDVRQQALSEALYQHHLGRVADLKHRIDGFEASVDEFEQAMAALGHADETRLDSDDQRRRGHLISGAFSYCQINASRRLYESNARLAQHMRRDIERIRLCLADADAARFSRSVGVALYPQIFSRPDPVEDFARSIAQTTETQQLIDLYRAQRATIERRMMTRINDYRDRLLAAWGVPMLYEPMAEYDKDMGAFSEELAALEARYLLQLRHRAPSATEDRDPLSMKGHER